jgi:outer membrane lipoprotein-sorting protein
LSRRWLVPAVVGAGIVGIGTVPHAFASGGSAPDLPPVTAAALLNEVASTSVRALSGTVRVDSALGLPALPDRLVGSGMGLPALLTGSHTLRVAVAGPDMQRIALLGDLSETDFVHDGTDLWVYDSGTNSVSHQTAAVDPSASGAAPAVSSPVDLTPSGAAQQWLADLDPSTAVSVAGTTTVAGRPAYELQATPRTPGTLIGAVRVAVDSATGVPLRVQVVPTGSNGPAFTVGFTSVSFTTPAAGTFRFTPPAGARVNQPGAGTTPAPVSGDGPQVQTGPSDGTGTTAAAGSSRPSVSGTGWASVVQLPAADLSSALPGTSVADPGRSRSGLDWIDRLSTQVPAGHLLTTRLFSLLVTDDGRVLIGAVAPGVLEAMVAS